MRVLIAGASVAGPTAAYWLARAGHEVTVVERTAGPRRGGGHAVDDPETGEASFERGPRRTFDVVIGADGLHSTVRRLVFGSEDQFMTFLGAYFAVFSLPRLYQSDGRTVSRTLECLLWLSASAGLLGRILGDDQDAVDDARHVAE